MKKNTELSIIIVNYKNYNLTIKCIESITKSVTGIDYDIIVIDNDSPNESYSKLESKFRNTENIEIIKNSRNSGFGAANNLGVERSNSKYVLILNPDIEVVDDAINKMLEKIKSDKNIGIVSGKLLNEDLSLQYSCRRILPFNEFLVARTPISKLVSPKKKEFFNNKYLMKDFNHNVSCEVEWVMGACMMIEKDQFEKVGGFSKDYFMYFEDVDLCYKVRKSGKRVIYLNEAKLIHLHEQESKKKFNKMTIIHLQSMLKFYYKYYFNKFN